LPLARYRQAGIIYNRRVKRMVTRQSYPETSNRSRNNTNGDPASRTQFGLGYNAWKLIACNALRLSFSSSRYIISLSFDHRLKKLTCSLALRPNTTNPSTATAPATAAATQGTQSPGCKYNSDRHSTGRPSTTEPLKRGYGGLMMSWEFGIKASRIV